MLSVRKDTEKTQVGWCFFADMYRSLNIPKPTIHLLDGIWISGTAMLPRFVGTASTKPQQDTPSQ